MSVDFDVWRLHRIQQSFLRWFVYREPPFFLVWNKVAVLFVVHDHVPVRGGS